MDAPLCDVVVDLEMSVFGVALQRTRAFATAAGRLKVRHPGSLQKACADVRRHTGPLSRLSGGA
jgi:hypothetical protein